VLEASLTSAQFPAGANSSTEPQALCGFALGQVQSSATHTGCWRVQPSSNVFIIWNFNIGAKNMSENRDFMM